jgi:serine/threonine-protein phosphatase CPPED1
MQHRMFYFRFTITLFLIFTFCHASPQNSRKDAPWFFIQLTDPQMGMFDNNRGFEKETALLEKAVTGVNHLHPDFVIITGDFVHNTNSADQIKEFKRIVATIDPGIPVFLTPGNHDIGQNPDQKSLKNYRQNFGNDRFTFRHKGSALIGINTSFINARIDKQEQKQYKWLEKALKRNRNAAHKILFCHFPFYNSTADEPESYSNIAPDYREKYLSFFKANGVDAVFSGHLHDNREFTFGNILLLTTSALGKPLGNAPSGLRIIKIYHDRIESNYYGIDELPEYVQFDR